MSIINENIKNKVIEIFNECQINESIHNNLIIKLYHLLQKNNHQINEIIQQCYNKILSFNKKEINIEKILNFYSLFCKYLIINQRNEEEFIININYLLSKTQSLNKTIRGKSCQTISTIFTLINEEIEIDINLWDTICLKLLPRLRDKYSIVRVWAIKSLKDFQKPSEINDLVIVEYLRLLESDPSKEVRLAVIESLCLCPHTLNSLLNRLKDIKSEVRLKTIEQMKGEKMDFI